MANTRIRLGELLLQKKLITKEQLDQAIDRQNKTGEKIGTALISLGLIKEDVLLNTLAAYLNIPYIDLKSYPLNKEIAKLLPERLARRYRMILLSKINNEYLLGMVDPQDILAIDEASHYLKAPVKVALFKEKDCLDALDSIYRRTDEINKFAGELTEQIAPDLVIEEVDRDVGLEDAPVAKLLRSIFEDAAQINASDIHIEPAEVGLRIRYRVDGVLQEHTINQPKIAPILTQRLKILARLNIMERRLPQDGHVSLKIKNKNYDVRLSTMPLQNGESVVMRLLEQGAKVLALNQIELPQIYEQELRNMLEAPYGMILTTGPTGSGKTTTLFALLNELNSPERNIITIEDPIEYRLPRLNQVQVNAIIDLSFASILRASLRQDPDVIMVGEIRDSETLSITLRSAMTGHLVLSTIHTNDTISTIDRMLDLGSEPFLIASTLRIVIAQRLLRRLCPNCQIDYIPSDIEKTWLERMHFDVAKATFKIGRGCTYCNGTGFRGRFAIFEILIMDQEMSNALRTLNLKEFYTLARKKRVPLWQTAIQAALDHKTSLNEVIQYAILQED